MRFLFSISVYLLSTCLALANDSSTTIKVASEILNTKDCQEFIRYSTKDVNTYGLVVLKNGEKQLELYDRGASEANLFKLWSISKLFTGLLLGTEIQKGKLSLDTKVSALFPTLVHESDLEEVFRNRLRVRHLFTLSSGLDWCETDICDASPSLSLYYGNGHNDALQFSLGKSMLRNPGTYYNYSSGDVTILSAVLRSLHTAEEYNQLPEKNLFAPLGIKNWVLEKDGKGLFLSGANLFLPTNDLAKLGQLILQKGEWKDATTGQRHALFSPAFYESMTSLNYPIQSPDTPEEIRRSEGPVGGLLWLNVVAPGQTQALRSAPRDTLYSLGNYGQNLLIFPTAGVVIARNGADAEFFGDLDVFADKATRCFAPTQWEDPSEKTKYAEPKASLVQLYQTFKTMQKENIVTHLIAQETCDCLFVEKFKDVESCRKRIPQADMNEYFSPSISVDWENKRVRVKTKFEDPTGVLLGSSEVEATAQFTNRAHEGCELR